MVLVGAGGLVLSLAACGSAAPSSPVAAPTAVQGTSEAPVTAEPTVEPEAESAETVTLVKMPNAVGMVLQDAQDLMQEVTGNPAFFTKSHDVRFTRMQVLDSGWKVCSQNVKKGEKFDPATDEVDFGVVKVDESCP